VGCAASYAWLIFNLDPVFSLGSAALRGARAVTAVLRTSGELAIAATRSALLQAVRSGARQIAVDVPLDGSGSVTRHLVLTQHDAETFLGDFAHDAPDRGGAEPRTTEHGPACTGAGCVPCASAKCFPAGTQVATPHGEVRIETLRVGDTVLAENPATGTVEAEPVEALLVRPVSDLMALDLSDGSTITVQPDHVFWLDRDPALTKPGWLTARRMHRGDALRTVSGRDVTVVRLRGHVGRAVVYTLTVAKDHTFFVGSAQVLVHNSYGCTSANGRSAQYEDFGLPTTGLEHDMVDRAIEANYLRSTIPTYKWSKITIAVAKKEDGSFVVAWNTRAQAGEYALSSVEIGRIQRMARKIFGPNVDFANKDGQFIEQTLRGTSGHGEVVLHKYLAQENRLGEVKVIGVSHADGACTACQRYFVNLPRSQRIIISYPGEEQAIPGLRN